MRNNYIIHRETTPSAMSQAVAPIARVWLWVQDRIAWIFGFKNSWNLAGAVTWVWLGLLVAAGMVTPLAPLVAIWGSITTAWVAWLVENKVTTTLAESDKKKITRIA